MGIEEETRRAEKGGTLWEAVLAQQLAELHLHTEDRCKLEQLIGSRGQTLEIAPPQDLVPEKVSLGQPDDRLIDVLHCTLLQESSEAFRLLDHQLGHLRADDRRRADERLAALGLHQSETKLECREVQDVTFIESGFPFQGLLIQKRAVRAAQITSHQSTLVLVQLGVPKGDHLQG